MKELFDLSDESKTKCKQCNGRGEYRVRIYYKNKHYYYYSKCGHCYAKGYIDWVESARGRKPGMAGYFIDNYPAGSLIIIGKNINIQIFGKTVNDGANFIYDGHNYIDVDTERGSALWDHFVTKEN